MNSVQANRHRFLPSARRAGVGSAHEPAMSDQAVAQRVLDHIANGTTDEGATIWREPVANYRSPERLQAELSRVLRRVPAPFCPSAALPETARMWRARPPACHRRGSGSGWHRPCLPQCLSASRHAGGKPAAAARAPSFAAITAGPTTSKGAAPHPHEAGFPGFDKERIRWCR
jgi:hypothetical protein